MIRLSTLLLAPPVGERLRARYDDKILDRKSVV